MEPLVKHVFPATPTPKKKKDSFEFDWKGKTYRAKYDLLKELFERESDTHVRCRMDGCGKHSVYQHKPNCGYSNVFGHLNSKHKDWKEKLILENPDQCYEIVKVASDITETELPSQLKFTQARYTLESESDSEKEEVVAPVKASKAAATAASVSTDEKKKAAAPTSVLGKRKNAKISSSSTPIVTAEAISFVLPDQFAELSKDRTNPVGKMMDLFLQHQQVQQDYHNQLLQLHYEQEQWRRDQELKERQLQEKRDTESSSIMVQMMTLFLQSQSTNGTATTTTGKDGKKNSSSNDEKASK